MFGKFVPGPGLVLVSITPKKEQTSSGLYVAQTHEVENSGSVIHSGDTAFEVGSKVFYRKFSGYNLDDNYIVLKSEDILGTMPHE